MDLARNLIGRVNVDVIKNGGENVASIEVEKVVLVEQLPKTSTGKIQKNVVRSEYAGHYEEG